MRMLALVVDSLREIYARKVIIGIVIIEIVTLTITTLILFSDSMQRDYANARLAVDGAPVDSTAISQEAPSFDREDSLLLGFDTAQAPASLQLPGDSSSEARSRSLEPESPAGPAKTPMSGQLVLEEKVKGDLGIFAIPLVLATVFLGIFATAGIVPSMMEKGTIDLLLSKPLPRWQLLWGRALGGIVAVGANLLLFSIALYALYGMATGIWYEPFVGITFLFGFSTFLFVYSGIVALNVTTESWVLPMSLAYIHLMILANFLSGRESSIFQWVSSPIVQGLVTGLYYALPQTADLMVQSGTAVHSGTILDASSLLQGTLFAIVMVSFATWRFQRKDF